MNAYLRDKLLQKLETLADERGYQVLDYVEFLESKYAERTAPGAAGSGNPLTRFADAVEEKLRAGKVSASAIAETMSLMNKAVGVLNGAAAAGKSVASDFMSATTRVMDAATSPAPPVRPTTAESAASGTTGASGGSAPGSAGGAAPASGSGSGDGFNPS